MPNKQINSITVIGAGQMGIRLRCLQHLEDSRQFSRMFKKML